MATCLYMYIIRMCELPPPRRTDVTGAPPPAPSCPTRDSPAGTLELLPRLMCTASSCASCCPPPPRGAIPNFSARLFCDALVTHWQIPLAHPRETFSSPSSPTFRNSLVAASLDVYSTVMRELLPTPAKTHYVFNLRDLSKVRQCSRLPARRRSTCLQPILL